MKVSFPRGTITEFYPNLETSTLTIGFGGQGPPLLLNGLPVGAVAVVVAAATMPDRWAQDPRLSTLFASAGEY